METHDAETHAAQTHGAETSGSETPGSETIGAKHSVETIGAETCGVPPNAINMKKCNHILTILNDLTIFCVLNEDNQFHIIIKIHPCFGRNIILQLE